MKNPFKHLKHTGLLLFLLAMSTYPAFAFEPHAVVLPRIEVIIPGVNRTIRVEQKDVYQQGIDKRVIIVIGYGGITITMNNISGTPKCNIPEPPPECNLPEPRQEDDNIAHLRVLGISSAGIVPLRKFGKTAGSLTAAVEIGDERLPFGIVWISSWVNSSENDPPFEYKLVITPFLDLYSEF